MSISFQYNYIQNDVMDVAESSLQADSAPSQSASSAAQQPLDAVISIHQILVIPREFYQ